MARVTYAPVTGKTVNKTAGVSKPQVTTMPQAKMPYQVPGPVKTPPVGGGTSGVSNSFNPSAPPVQPPPKPGPMPHSGGPPPTDLPPVRILPPKPFPSLDNVPSIGGKPGSYANDAYTPIPNIGLGGKPPAIPTPPEVVSHSVGRIPPYQSGWNGIHPFNPPPGGGTVTPFNPPPFVPPGGYEPIPEPIGGNGSNRKIVGQSLNGIPPVVPPGGYAPIPEPTLPIGYNPGGGAGGIATQPVSNPVNNPETPIQNNADRAELAPPPGSWTKFSDRGKWSGQDAQAQNIANRRAKKNTSGDEQPDTGNLITPNVGKKKNKNKTGGGVTNSPKQGGQNGTPEAAKGANNGNAKQGKNAKVTKADKQKAKNRKPQPGTPARPYRTHGVNYRPLGYGGSLRI